MPHEAIKAASIQHAFQQELKQKRDCGNNDEDREIHAVNVELADHGTLSHPVTLAAWFAADSAGAAAGVFIGR